MSDGTKIEWADATVNAINGCSVTSPGCTNCYAMKQAHRFDVRRGLTTKTKGGMVWTGEVSLNEKALLQPLAWKRPRRIFWNAHGDTFHDAVPDEWIDRVMAVCALTPQHTHMILTKRSKRMREYFSAVPQPRWIDPMKALAKDFPRPEIVHPKSGGVLLSTTNSALANVWLGVSVEDQTRADERIPDLLATPAAVRFLSCEPLLGPVNLNGIQAPRYCEEDAEVDWRFNCLSNGDYYWYDCGDGYTDCGDGPYREHHIDWVIAGGESGPGARPMHPDWARSLRDQCAAAGVPFHFKQWGEWGQAFPKPSETPGRYAMMARDSAGWTHTSALMLDRYPRQFNSFGSVVLERLGKKRAGRLLDGVEHNGMPGETA